MAALWDTSTIIHIGVPGQSARAAKPHAVVVWWTAQVEVRSVLERFSICAADALHLGAALVWCRQKPRGRLFVCGDLRLGNAAPQAGFTIEAV